MPDCPDIPGIADIRHAQRRILDRVRTTPVIEDADLNAILGCRMFCKCEHLQRTGSFKFRGASNAVSRLREDGIEGDLATHSSGNHGAALALAARLDGRRAHVVMPDNSSAIKVEAVRRYGGKIHFCAATHLAREDGLAECVGAGHIPIPPYDHADIIAGQGTAALELVQTHPELEILIAPVGGGGLISGTALVAAEFGMETFAAEPAGAADTAASIEQGRRVESWHPDTIADGLRALIGKLNFAVIRQHVSQVLTVSEDEIRDAMSVVWDHLRMLIEPSSAVALAAIGKHPEIFSGKRVGAIITGANIAPADWLSLTGDTNGTDR